MHRTRTYVVPIIWSSLLFCLILALAVKGWGFSGIDEPLFRYINDLPQWLGAPMYIITQLGGLIGLAFWLGFAYLKANKSTAVTVLIAGGASWGFVSLLKAIVQRGRPQEFMYDVNLFHDKIYAGFGFPSGHSTFAAVCATVLFYHVHPKYRKYLIITVFLVGISRIYLGAHFPYDVLGGWLLGITCGSIAVLMMHMTTKIPSTHSTKK